MIPSWRLSVAPMMDWTDRHCRFFHRQLSRRALLYTEMVTAEAVIHGDRERLLGHDAIEHPLALQLGGAEPDRLAHAVELARPWGFDEFNLNVGCPSDRVQSGTFGAVLMKDPARVGDCVAAMASASGGVEVTVKCRIGVDDQDPRAVLPAFLETIQGAGVRRVIVHARKAWLRGLSPRENREVPPLEHDLVVEMKRAFPALDISINGGIADLDTVEAFLRQGLDGVMVGRAAYHDPATILAGADARIFGDARPVPTGAEVIAAMVPYVARHVEGGGSVHHVTRHMLGLFAGRPGARAWRRILSEGAARADATPALLETALAAVPGGDGPLVQPCVATRQISTA